METKWLEDFISLAETHNFSRSAALRHVTQPAFSRRIQSLENWLGIDLVDRTSLREIAKAKPTSLEQMRGVSGVGEKKLASYGDEIVAMILEMI